MHEAVRPYVQRVRWVSMLASMVTVAAFFGAVRHVFGAQAGALAALALVLVPQFGFISTAVGNDSLVAAFSALAFYALLVMMSRPDAPWVALGAGALAGAAVLTKASAVVLLPVGVLAAAMTQATIGRRAGLASGFLLGFASLTGWWLAGNLSQGGDPLRGMQDAILAFKYQERGFVSSYWITRFPIVLFASFWGVFGWMMLRLPVALYAAYAIVSGALLVGLVAYTRRVRRAWTMEARCVVLAAGAFAAAFAALVLFNRHYNGYQGRLLYPVLAPLGVLAVAGAAGLLERWPQLGGYGSKPVILFFATGALVGVATAWYGFGPVVSAAW
jgi:hypothetical protein